MTNDPKSPTAPHDLATALAASLKAIDDDYTEEMRQEPEGAAVRRQ